MSRRLVVALLLTLAPLTACGPKLIPGTEVEESDDNKAILDTMEGYRRAVQAKDIDRIMRLVSTSFFDDAGAPEAGVQVDYNGLKAKLEDWAKKTKNVRVEMQVKKITLADEGKTAKARYFYDVNYEIAGPEGVSQWKHDGDIKEMSFKKENGVWKITSGI